MRRIALILTGFLALAGLIGFAATNGGLGTSDEEASGATGSTGRSAAADGFETAPVSDETGRDAAVGGSVSELPLLPEIGPSVIRTASISLEVRKGGFGGAFDAASLVAGRYGGFVQSSTTAGTEVRTGDLVLRIPADRFDEAMTDLRALGTVQRQELSGEDVSAQFVDLEARLRTWQSQEAVLLDLMGDATTVEETIRVQGELQDVQLRIEQVKGQLRLLEDRTAFATIQVSLREPGTPAATDDTARPSLAEAWERALDGFLGVWYAVVVGLGYLIPLAAIAGLGWLVVRRVSASRAAAPSS
jgi:hypothetical protein